MNLDDKRDTETERLDRVALAAAAAFALGRPKARVSVRAVPGRQEDGWVREGRLTVQSAHRTWDSLIRPGK
jgi:hypothetical protein